MKKSPTSRCRSSADAGNSYLGRTRFFVGSRRGEPQQWLYATRPFFARLHEPLAEALLAAEEVRLILDLQRFNQEDVRLEIKPDRYSITAANGNTEFFEEIVLPESVDTLKKEEHFSNGILELVLPRKTRPARIG